MGTMAFHAVAFLGGKVHDSLIRQKIIVACKTNLQHGSIQFLRKFGFMTGRTVAISVGLMIGIERDVGFYHGLCICCSFIGFGQRIFLSRLF